MASPSRQPRTSLTVTASAPSEAAMVKAWSGERVKTEIALSVGPTACPRRSSALRKRRTGTIGPQDVSALSRLVLSISDTTAGTR